MPCIKYMEHVLDSNDVEPVISDGLNHFRVEGLHVESLV